MRLQFITKQRGIYASSGLRNFVRFIVDMMTEMGVEVKAVDVIPRTAKIAPPPASSTFPPLSGSRHRSPVADHCRPATGHEPLHIRGWAVFSFFLPPCSTLVSL